MKNDSSTKELDFRRDLCRYILMILNDVDDNDPRKADAIAEYERQLEEIEKQIATLKPPPVVVGLETAALFGAVGE